MQKYEKQFLLLSVLAVIVCFYYLSPYDGVTTDGVLFTLISVFVNAIVFVILFTVIQRKESQKNELRYKTDLKRSMRERLTVFFTWAQPLGSEVAYIKVLSNERAIKTLIEEMSTKIPLNAVQIGFFTDFAKREISSLEAMLPIAANIGHEHFTIWYMIITNLKGVVASESEEKSIELIHWFLLYSSNFDSISVRI